MNETRRPTVERLFPEGNYTPFGYIDNPYHSAVMNRSGVIRTVPPIGFGFWCRDLPFPYGTGFGHLRTLNYLSFVHPSLHVDGVSLRTGDDYLANGIELRSLYHSKNVMSYDFSFRGVEVSLQYFLHEEDALSCVVDIRNDGQKRSDTSLYLTHIYGYPQRRWWGCDGFTGRYNPLHKAIVSKMYAYGDVFCLGSTLEPSHAKATANASQWESWIDARDASSNIGAASDSSNEPLYNTIGYDLSIAPGGNERFSFVLVRDVNEEFATEKLRRCLPRAFQELERKVLDDNGFYSTAPELTGDFPGFWKRGVIYHLETIRMTMRPPVGRFRHYWDAMQVHTPRAVLGETAIDTMCLSYGDPELAKDVIYGTFADAIAPHVPCVREDGSVNMISKDGAECATAPIWVLLFPTIRFIHARTGDDVWIAKLYPYLVRYLKWWEDNRTDSEGYFHVNNSWEAQDGSLRFATEYEDGEVDVAANVSGVRTIDLQAAMADGYRCVAYFSRILRKAEDEIQLTAMAEKHVGITRSMFRDGEFRDFDGRTGKPIIQADYHDVMMTAPYAVDVADDGQKEQGKKLIEYFTRNPIHWLEWPSFLYIYTEAAWNCGMRQLAADVVYGVAEREYPKLDAREPRPVMSEARQRVLGHRGGQSGGVRELRVGRHPSDSHNPQHPRFPGDDRNAGRDVRPRSYPPDCHGAIGRHLWNSEPALPRPCVRRRSCRGPREAEGDPDVEAGEERRRRGDRCGGRSGGRRL